MNLKKEICEKCRKMYWDNLEGIPDFYPMHMMREFHSQWEAKWVACHRVTKEECDEYPLRIDGTVGREQRGIIISTEDRTRAPLACDFALEYLLRNENV